MDNLDDDKGNHLSEHESIDEFASTKASLSLRICCYGSSSSTTPKNYLDEAYNLGKILAKRGHTCVNGAGLFGCMGALNNGCLDYDGHVVGVIHEMFIVDGSDWVGGSHSVFESGNRELLIARGDDLQQRKKMLVKDADALIVLPGGPGTWDELMEMACAKNLGLMDLPIVCINIDGYYDHLGHLFHRGYNDGLITVMPHETFRFESTAAAAVKSIESDILSKKRRAFKSISVRRRNVLRAQGSMIGDAMGYISSIIFKGGLLEERLSSSCDSSLVEDDDAHQNADALRGLVPNFLFLGSPILTFTIGLGLGLGIATSLSLRRK